MLRHYLLIPAITLVVLTMVSADLEAQAPNQRMRRPSVRNNPPVSPYLNLLRRDSSVANNYFNLVRPEQEFRQGIINNNQQISHLQQQTSSLQIQQNDTTMYLRRQAAGSTLGATGHPTSFMNYGQYYRGRR